MKLIPLIILTISLAVDNKAHEHFTFPPHFQSDIFTSEKNPYLPPESHTPLSYFQINNINKLPFPYLPPTASKAPMGYPSPFPMTFSSTMRPLKIDNDDDDDDDKPTSQVPPFLRNKFNRTERMPNQMAERREIRYIPKSSQNPIDRIDTKIPFQFNTSPEPSLQSGALQTMSPRSNIINLQRDHSMDQMKAASYPGAQYIPQPSIFVSSTTETAIPILRLSNEMDLDGSFSYEALGADQTHYVQHSRMENAGTGKDEQVVEGSYSYVGDNGKTYSVHYIADANGFRASGDHLPVAPPIPEIIQRAIQYNLAEESKKPPHLKSWNGEQQENELSESEKRHQFAVSPPRLSSLFTGKTPESFSHSFTQSSNTQNNLVAAASSQSPVQATIDFTDQMQTKQNSGTISPQITFLASQGAHVPSVNTPQQTINRMFTTEKSTMPQLVNYEANMKEADQESNKALWRWQYGLNANANQNMDKTSISRSFGADDIVINVNDMTAEQYSKMITQQLEPNVKKENLEVTQKPENSFTKESYYDDYQSTLDNNNDQYNNDNLQPEKSPVNGDNNQYSTESITPTTYSDDLYKNQYITNMKYLKIYNDNSKQYEGTQTSRPKLILQQQFIPQSQTVTQAYEYDDENFESRKTKKMESYTTDSYNMNLSVIPLNYEQYNVKPEKNESKNKSNIIVTQESPTTTTKLTANTTIGTHLKFTDFIVPENKDNFRPLFQFTKPHPAETTTKTETTIENAFEDNIFLKNFFRNKNDNDVKNKTRENDNKINFPAKSIDTRLEKNPKLVQYQPKPFNEIQFSKRKPMDIAAILNFISKNQFESSKLKLTPIIDKQMPNNFKQNTVMHYLMPEQDGNVDDTNNRNYRTLQQQQELHGVIKNYKVLQRNNKYTNGEKDKIDGLKRNISPSPMKTANLPPLGRAGPSMKSYLPPIYA